jgi:hypothetical protein
MRAVLAILTCTCLAAALGAPAASAQDGGQLPTAEIEVQGWALQNTTGSSVGARISLDEAVQLEAYAAGTHGSAEATSLSYTELRWGDVRLGGGTYDGDAGLHLGYAPSLQLRLHDRATLTVGLDAAAGIGYLQRSAGANWGGQEIYSAALSLNVEFAARPWDPLLLRVGTYGEALGAVSSAGESPTLGDVVDLSRELDLGVAGALSRGAVGAFGEARVSLISARPAPGRELRWTLGYEESWDWIHLDPTISVLRELEPFGFRVKAIPVRTTRVVATRVLWEVSGEARLGLRLEGRHVQGSTTLVDFADRNGWSVAARIEGALGDLYGELEARTHVKGHRLDELWGAAPRTQVKAQLGGVLYDGQNARVRLEGRFQWTVDDAFGFPREGYAASAVLAVEFGSQRSSHDRLLRTQFFELARTRHRLQPNPARRPTDADDPADAPQTVASGTIARPPTPTEVPTEINEGLQGRPEVPVGALEFDLDTLAEGLTNEELEQLARELDTPGELDIGGILERNPGIRARAHQFLRSSRPALAIGYGQRDVQAAVITLRASRDAITSRLDPRASLDAITDRFDPDALSLGPLEITQEPVDRFASRRGVEAFSLVEPKGRTLQLLVQARGPWNRFMDRLLTGRGRR